ncbi:hypothetical protein PG987_008748 [Apiospora arundinis]
MKPEELKNGKFKTARGKTNESRPDAKHKPDNAIVSVTQQVDTSASFKEPEHIVEVAAGGIVKQDIRETFWFGLDTWDSDHTITIPVHILNPDAYRQVTGRTVPPSPSTTSIFFEPEFPCPTWSKGSKALAAFSSASSTPSGFGPVSRASTRMVDCNQPNTRSMETAALLLRMTKVLAL